MLHTLKIQNIHWSTKFSTYAMAYILIESWYKQLLVSETLYIPADMEAIRGWILLKRLSLYQVTS